MTLKQKKAKALRKIAALRAWVTRYENMEHARRQDAARRAWVTRRANAHVKVFRLRRPASGDFDTIPLPS